VAPPLPAPITALGETPIEDPEVQNVVVVLPPAVADKRCLSCPPPKLPPAFVQLGVEQKVVVKTCVGAKGNVTSVNVLRGLGPLLTRRRRHRPRLALSSALGGRPPGAVLLPEPSSSSR
jgi:hypothetical protein